MVIVAATPKPVIDVEAVAEAVRRGPVTVQAGGKDAFIAVDPADYRRLAEADRVRREQAWAEMETAMNRVAAKVAAELSPEEIAALERDIIDED